ncbi:MAG: hypothetical protein CMB73_05845 [Euryarchaeota archaeon]|jgi:hypothetical protein|nr:hypothetical protein [Euryarchaeota archaeon]
MKHKVPLTSQGLNLGSINDFSIISCLVAVQQDMRPLATLSVPWLDSVNLNGAAAKLKICKKGI